ncbi:hypothetical protein AWY96_00045 [Serratia plymuthica]|nr:hypothetical protein AWY96_00045 [Serratia plymuthica]
MPPFQIIKAVDIIDNISDILTSGFITTIVNPLCFQDAKKPFRNSIIQAVTFSTHTTCNIQFLLAGLELVVSH